MKKLVLLSILSLLFIACEDNAPSKGRRTGNSYGKLTKDAVVATGDAKDIFEFSATIMGCASLQTLAGSDYNIGVLYSEEYKDINSLTLDNDVEYELTDHYLLENKFEVPIIGLTPKTTYYYRTFVYCNNMCYYGDIKHFATSEFTLTKGDAVDLGLSVKWASHNLGAGKPQEYGNYYYWGDVKPKVIGEYPVIWPFMFDELEGIVLDDQMNLTPDFDAATATLGSAWHMPTKEQMRELNNLCEQIPMKYEGVQGVVFVGPNKNRIFIPSENLGEDANSDSKSYDGAYWSSTADEEYYYSGYHYANTMIISRTGEKISTRSIASGLAIRPVTQ